MEHTELVNYALGIAKRAMPAGDRRMRVKEKTMENKCSSGGECGCSVEHASCGHAACETRKAACCQVEQAVEMWTCAGHQAWKEVHVDLLKAKILKAWGPQMEKTADAVIEAMGTQWQAMMAQGKAKTDLKQKIVSIFSEQKK
jgi:hypothetical protein